MMFGAQVGRASSPAADTETPLPSGPALTEKMLELFADLVSHISLNQYFALSLEIIITYLSASLDTTVLLFYDYSSSRSFGGCRNI